MCWVTQAADASRSLLAAAELAAAQPAHPYAVTGVEALGAALLAFKQAMVAAGYPFDGDGHSNYLLPSALGVARPTALVPRTMIAGDLRRPEPIVVVGFDNFKDFYPTLIAANLVRGGFAARAVSLTAPVPGRPAADDAGTRF